MSPMLMKAEASPEANMALRFAFRQRLNHFEDLIQSEFLDEGGIRFGCDSRQDAIPTAGLRFLGAREMHFRRVEFCVEFGDVLGEAIIAAHNPAYGASSQGAQPWSLDGVVVSPAQAWGSVALPSASSSREV
ncbi:unnamed protein product [Sphagnum tenellum]